MIAEFLTLNFFRQPFQSDVENTYLWSKHIEGKKLICFRNHFPPPPWGRGASPSRVALRCGALERYAAATAIGRARSGRGGLAGAGRCTRSDAPSPLPWPPGPSWTPGA